MPARDLTDVMAHRAVHSPDAVAYEFSGDAGFVSTLTYAQVAARAAELAMHLDHYAPGPVLLALPPGPDYTVALFGGFLARRPLIPAYPPSSAATGDLARLDGIVADARPAAVLTEDGSPALGIPVGLAVPGADADGTPCRSARPGGDDVAIIQYTSGSTGRPKGVLVRHGSLAANAAAISERFGLTADSRAVSWLPPFHDMGLVGGLLTPMAAGIPMRVLSPMEFIKSPLSWLRHISATGATASGGPNFAYELCVRRARSADALDGLDLSAWRVAFNGGETVKASTLRAFADTFAPVGFHAEAFLPCYGLAEATLIVSAGHWNASTSSAVSCGTPVTGQQVAIVDTDNDTGCARPAVAGAQGEIWVSGDHVTAGYLSSGSDELFGVLDGRRYLRTGDLGYLDDGELVVTGRSKDVLVHHGVNYHATDVEAAALDAAGGLGRRGAAFLVDIEPEAIPVLVLEVRGGADDALETRVRATVLERTGLRLEVIALVPPRSVPRTSSGKVRRSACREAFLSGVYDDAVVAGDRPRLQALAARRSREAAIADLAGLICGIVAAVCDIARCGPDDALADLAVDSLRAAEASAVIEDALRMRVPLEVVLSARTSREAATELVRRWADEGCMPEAVGERVLRARDLGGDLGEQKVEVG